jgi:DNA-directed RNA polymerase specialized sigma24 family protein
MPAKLETQRPVASDAELLQRLVRRDSTALVEVERRHWASLYAQVYGMLVESALAERIVREAFTQLWFAAERFPLKRSVWTWLRDMARELARAELALAASRDPVDSSIRRVDEASLIVHPGAPAAGIGRGADAESGSAQ